MPLDLHFFGGQLLALQLEAATEERTCIQIGAASTRDKAAGDDEKSSSPPPLRPRPFNFQTQWTENYCSGLTD